MNWIKKENKFILPNNDINFNVYKETLKNIDIPDKSYIYIPTHNINDVFEWYRIFNDSYSYNPNFDERGFAIHGWFSKNRGQSIKGWYPNLYEVKCATTDDVEYYIDSNNNYFKRSIDYIDVFNDVPDLHIDGVKILFNDVVLIKNQHYEQLHLFTIDSQLSIKNKYYSQILPHETQYFNIGNDIILKDNNGNYHKDKIININYTTINSIDYIIVQTEKYIENVSELADINSGLWLYTTKDAENGVYYYDGVNELKPILHMFDKYQTYNQIIYCYLGDTNQNKEFYLRRNENITSPNYSTFPHIGLGEPLYYSEGSAYLIKCRFNYDLSIIDNSNTIINPNCCSCNLQIGDPTVAHPTGNPPYDIDSTAFRLLFLDNSTAEKIFSSYELGVGKYKLDNKIDITDPKIDIKFDINDEILKDLYYSNNPSTSININNNFTYNELGTGESYEIIFDDYNINNLVITQNTTTVSTTTNNQTTSSDIIESTKIKIKYNNSDRFPTIVFNSGDYINIEIIDKNNNETILKHQFVILDSLLTNSHIELEIYQPFSQEIIDTINSIQDVTFKISAINTYGLESGATVDENRQNLLDTLNKSIVGKIYEFDIIEYNGLFYLDFIKIRQNLKHKYFDLSCDIETTDDALNNFNYSIDSEILANYREYFYGYNIEDYLKNYLGIQSLVSPNTLDLPYLQDVTFTYNNVITNESRFDISGSNKNGNNGNIITYGRDYKVNVLDKIKKHTLVKISYNDSTPDAEDIFIYDIDWDEELNYGKIILSKEIAIPNNNVILTIEPYRSVKYISDTLKKIFDKKINSTHNNNHVDNTFPDYKIETMSYAHAMMNYATGVDGRKDEILNNITAIFYNSYNELQASFLKRDRYFPFRDDEIIDIQVVSTANINLSNNIPATIDGYTLSDGDLVIIKDQTDQTQNGVYVCDISDTNKFIRYDTFRKNICWNVLNGAYSGKQLYVYFNEPFIIDIDPVVFIEKSFKTKKDPRLTLEPIEIYKLGVDNKTQPPIKINIRYDVTEYEENKISIDVGSNSQYQIRFIDGLTEYNILNDINGQGKYAWILDENTITHNAVVGCTQTNGPGTGDLIWYTGTWIKGIWCYGIWVQGVWLDGTWLDGIRKANNIIDNYSYVLILTTIDNALSNWVKGTWYNGINENGIFEYVDWINGTFNNGIIFDGVWHYGIFNNGEIKHILWKNGNFYGGRFLTGEWLDGLFDQLDTSIPTSFGYGATDTGSFKTRAIWRTGEFKRGSFYSGMNSTDHRLSVFYSGTFGGTFYGGSFIFGEFNGIFKNGVWFGGYSIQSFNQQTGTIVDVEILPEEYDIILGLTGLTDYVSNNKHNLHKYNNNFILFGEPVTTSPESDITFINEFYSTQTVLDYVPKPLELGSTDTLLSLDITSNISVLNPPNEAYVLSKFVGTFEDGVWMHGYFGFGSFLNGLWVKGFFNNGNFGNI